LILKRVLSAAAAISVIAAAAGVAVVAAAFALYALLRESLTPAGSAAVVAGLAALLAALVGAILLLIAKPPKPLHQEESLTSRAIDLARQKPLIAAGVALVAGLIAVRNPKILTAAVTAFLAGKAAPKK
jgi:hypothetical protein